MTTHDSRRTASTVSSGLLPVKDSTRSGKLGDRPFVAGRPIAFGMMVRFGWGLADQLLSSATNFLLAVLIARTVGARDLGAFSVAYATFTFSLGAVRAIAAELLVVRHSAATTDVHLVLRMVGDLETRAP